MSRSRDDPAQPESNRALIVSPTVEIDAPASCWNGLRVRQGSSTFGMQATGNVVWDGSKTLARLLESEYSLQASDPNRPMAGLRVLELGAGSSGIPGIAAWLLGAEVCFTDLSSQLGLLRETLVANGINGPRVGVRELDWSAAELPASECWGNRPFDVILAAECLFEGTDAALARTLLHFLRFSDQNSAAGQPRDLLCSLEGRKSRRQAVALLCNTNRRAVHIFRRRMQASVAFETIPLPGRANKNNSYSGSNEIAWRVSLLPGSEAPAKEGAGASEAAQM